MGAGDTIPDVPLDPGPPGPGTPRGDDGGSYGERLRVPLRWWALATMFWASALLAFLVALPAWVAFLMAAVPTALTVAIFLSYGAAEVSVVDGIFQAGRARIPVHLLAEPQPLGAAEAKRAAGVDADARAYLLLRPYLAQAVKVRVTDPQDPTPYWLVSTRHPGTLAQVLASEIGPGVRPRERH